MAKKVTYLVYEVIAGDVGKRGWYYTPTDGTATGPFTSKEIADAAGNLWKVSTEMRLKGKS